MNEETHPGSYMVKPPRPRVGINILLFVATVISTLFAGAIQQNVNPIRSPHLILEGLPFSAALMSILLVHELGHFFVSRRHGVAATLPYFIPMPNFIGTLGAFIIMRGAIRDRRSLLEIGAAGPIAGFVLAVPLTIIGLSLSQVELGAPPMGGITLGDSILFSLLSRVVLGIWPNEALIVLHPIAFAGWIGLFITALNMLPMGQLDGGHIAYALFSRWHKWISIGTALTMPVLGIMGWPGWFIWAILPLLMRFRHPQTLDPVTPLDGPRKMMAAISFVILGLTFVPVPFTIL